MTRAGSGNAWKHRNYDSDFPRTFKTRKLKSVPQYTVDDLYISPLCRRRRYNEEDGRAYYEPMERRLKPSGIHILDQLLLRLTQGKSSMREFVNLHGLRTEDVDSLIFLLTGMRGIDFRQAYQSRLVDELLRYTDLEQADVARLSGLGTAYNLYLVCKRDHGVAPGVRRKQLQKEGDVGRFAL